MNIGRRVNIEFFEMFFFIVIKTINTIPTFLNLQSRFTYTLQCHFKQLHLLCVLSVCLYNVHTH